jgi:hypothetical protein
MIASAYRYAYRILSQRNPTRASLPDGGGGGGRSAGFIMMIALDEPCPLEATTLRRFTIASA